MRSARFSKEHSPLASFTAFWRYGVVKTLRKWKAAALSPVLAARVGAVACGAGSSSGCRASRAGILWERKSE